MSMLFRTLASSTGLVQCLLDLATWLLARTLQMPEPMVHAAVIFLMVRLQAARLTRALAAWLRVTI